MMNQDIIKLLKKIASMLNEFLVNHESEIHSEENQSTHSQKNEEMNENNSVSGEHAPNRKVDGEIDKERVEKYINYIFSRVNLTPDMFIEENEHQGIIDLQNFYQEYIRDFVNTRGTRSTRQKIPDKHTELYKHFEHIQRRVRSDRHPYNKPYAKECWTLTWDALKRM